jgi:putative NADH-flavin reductase
MKLLLFGITGRTGSLVAAEAVRRGHKVIGIARQPEKVTIKDAEIVAGTPYDFDTVRNAIIGCDAVIIALSLLPQSGGLFGKLKTEPDLLSKSTSNAVKAMKEKGIKRLVVLSALGAGDSVREIPSPVFFLMRLTNIKYSYIDHDEQEKVVEKSDLDWTIVRPVGLTDRNENLSVLYNLKGTGKIRNSISRNAVAHFMLDCIEKSQFIKQKPGISNS